MRRPQAPAAGACVPVPPRRTPRACARPSASAPKVPAWKAVSAEIRTSSSRAMVSLSSRNSRESRPSWIRLAWSVTVSGAQCSSVAMPARRYCRTAAMSTAPLPCRSPAASAAGAAGGASAGSVSCRRTSVPASSRPSCAARACTKAFSVLALNAVSAEIDTPNCLPSRSLKSRKSSESSPSWMRFASAGMACASRPRTSATRARTVSNNESTGWAVARAGDSVAAASVRAAACQQGPKRSACARVAIVEKRGQSMRAGR